MKIKNHFRQLRFLNFGALVMITLMFFVNRSNTQAEIAEMHMSIDSLRNEIQVDEVIRTNIQVKDAVDSLQKTLLLLSQNEKSNLQFYNDLGHRESRGNYKIVNRFGFLGKYQFSPKTLKGLGFDVTDEEYLNDTLMQEEAARLYIAFNKKVLKKWIKKYSNTVFRVTENDTIYDIHVTESGLLAAAHLGGAGNVQKLFEENKVFKDGNGVPITDYITQFAGYKM